MQSFLNFLKEADPGLVIVLSAVGLIGMAMAGVFILVLAHGPEVFNYVK